MKKVKTGNRSSLTRGKHREILKDLLRLAIDEAEFFSSTTGSSSVDGLDDIRSLESFPEALLQRQMLVLLVEEEIVDGPAGDDHHRAGGKEPAETVGPDRKVRAVRILDWVIVDEAENEENL